MLSNEDNPRSPNYDIPKIIREIVGDHPELWLGHERKATVKNLQYVYSHYRTVPEDQLIFVFGVALMDQQRILDDLTKRTSELQVEIDLLKKRKGEVK